MIESRNTPENDGPIGTSPHLRVMESDVTARTASEARRIVANAITANGYVIVDEITRPYPIGRDRWHMETAVVKATWTRCDHAYGPGECPEVGCVNHGH